MKTALLCFATMLCMSLAAAGDVQPEPTPIVRPASVITVSRCAKLLSVVFVAADGTLHPLDVSHMTLDQVLKILAPFPNDPEHALGVVVPCGDAGAI